MRPKIVQRKKGNMDTIFWWNYIEKSKRKPNPEEKGKKKPEPKTAWTRVNLVETDQPNPNPESPRLPLV